mmetsp:Transcript_2438/g.3412  ORF Transcript_2438/g.3412 Transcript_2438/m.3412 type:complete len:82 (+) Transcript_2438:415-660(+)
MMVTLAVEQWKCSLALPFYHPCLRLLKYPLPGPTRFGIPPASMNNLPDRRNENKGATALLMTIRNIIYLRQYLCDLLKLVV